MGKKVKIELTVKEAEEFWLVAGSAQAHIPKEKGETYEILLYLLDESLPTNFGGVTFWRANG